MQTPTNHRAEELALSSLMRGGHEVRRIASERLTAEMFTRHAGIAETALRLAEQGRRPDPETLSAEMDGGAVHKIAEVRCRPMNIEEYVEAIRDAYLKRRMLVGFDGLIEATGSDEPARDIQERAEKFILDLGRETTVTEGHPLSALAPEAMEEIRRGLGKTVTGVPTGFYKIDERTRGWQPEDLIIIAGRTSMGKTSFALASSLRAADEGVPVALISLEMSGRRLARRLIGMKARINTQQTDYTDQQMQKLEQAESDLADLPYHIVDTPGMTYRSILAVLRRMQAEEGIGLAVIDYAQKIAPEKGRSYNSRHDYLTDAAHGLKDGAQELGIPLLLISQINRGVEHRSEKRPLMSDLRESGSLEEAADIVALLYRPDYYGETEDENGDSIEGTVEFIIGKNRNGPIGMTRLAFVEEHAAFENLDFRSHQNGQAPRPPKVPDEYPF